MSEESDRFVRVTAELPDSQDERVDIYQTDPYVHTLVKRYAEMNDCSVEEIVYEGTEDVVGVPYRNLGLMNLEEVDQIQDKVDEAVQNNDRV